MNLAFRLLAAILPTTVAGRSTLGDLTEEYHRRPRGLRRIVWSWFIACDVMLRYFPGYVARLLGGFGGDVLYAARLSRRYPAPVLAGILSLSLAIGISTAAFSIANGVWLRFSLTADPSMVKIWRVHANGASLAWPLSEFSEMRAAPKRVTVEGVLPSTELIGASVASTPQETAMVSFVTGGYLPMLGARSVAGRLLALNDDRPSAPAVVVLDHLYWRRHFAADFGVLGRIVSIRGTNFTIVGVANRDFMDPSGVPTSLWAPLASFDRLVPIVGQPPPEPLMIGRLNGGVSIRQANAELTNLVDRLAPAAAAPQRATGTSVAAAVSDGELAINRLILVGVFSVIAIVLVVACANVSNLQLAGAASRRPEIAMRLSLGASRRRVLRQFVTESALLSSASGALGLLLARWLAPLLLTGIGAPDVDVDPDLRVYVFVASATAIAAIGTGFAAAYYGSRTEVSTRLMGSTSRDGDPAESSRAKSIFIGSQTAASIVMIALAALQVRALAGIAGMEPGFDVSSLLSVAAEFPRTPEGRTHEAAFWPRAVERVRSLPGVERAALVTSAPFTGWLGDPVTVLRNGTDADYFATIGLHPIRGRSYTAAEVAGHEPVAVISEQLARRFWGNDDPLGTSASRIDSSYAGFQVLGIVPDTLFDRVDERRTPIVYVPLMSGGRAQIAIRTRDPEAMSGAVRDAVRTLSPEMRLTVTVIGDSYRRAFERPRHYAALTTSVAIFALVLSVVGVFGVTSFAVRTRTREVGIRIALGARAVDVTDLLVRESLRPVIVGLFVGLVLALLGGHLIAGLLSGSSEDDPVALIAAVFVLLTASLVAVLVPARRAARLDPAVVLRDA